MYLALTHMETIVLHSITRCPDLKKLMTLLLMSFLVSSCSGSGGPSNPPEESTAVNDEAQCQAFTTALMTARDNNNQDEIASLTASIKALNRQMTETDDTICFNLRDLAESDMRNRLKACGTKSLLTASVDFATQALTSDNITDLLGKSTETILGDVSKCINNEKELRTQFVIEGLPENSEPSWCGPFPTIKAELEESKAILDTLANNQDDITTHTKLVTEYTQLTGLLNTFKDKTPDKKFIKARDKLINETKTLLSRLYNQEREKCKKNN